MKTLLALPLLIFLLLTGNPAHSQQVLVKGIVKDTISSRYYLSGRILVILNDTILRSYRLPYVPANKRKPEKRTLAQRMAEHERDSIAYMRRNELHKDKRFVVSPNQDGEFEILAKPTDSLVFQSHSFISQRHAVQDLMKQQSINIKLEPVPCEPMFRCDDKNPKLYVFIGEKISSKFQSVNYCPENGRYSISPDSRYMAKYKILENIYGGYPNDTISFVAYDHYGKPPFLAYKYVMLFVSESCGRLFHEKYQYFDVYPTADGRWARPGDPYRFDTKQPKIFKAHKLNFKKPLSFDISNEYESVIKEEYPKPYFRITRNKAYPLKGVYADALFAIKKEGVLKARGHDLDTIPPAIKK